MQNLMMTHGDSRTFLRHYLSRLITIDTQAVVRGLQPQDALMRAACTMSRSIDPRRPRRLTPEQSASVNDHPRIQLLLRRRDKFKRKFRNATKHRTYIELNQEINQERQRQRRALLKDIKKRWEHEQPVRDVEQQLAGLEVEDGIQTELLVPMLPAQKKLFDAIMAPPGATYEEEMRRRNRAVRLVTEYCGVEEGGMLPSRLKRQSSSVTPTGKSQDSSQIDLGSKALEAAKVSVFREKRPKICFCCLANPNLPIETRVYEFYTPGDLTKHFKRKHLRYIKEGDRLSCKLCQVDLEDKMHLQRHAHDVHGTVS